MSFDDLINFALHLFWPVSCPICGRVGEILCEECFLTLFQTQLPRCLSCGRVFPCPSHTNAALIRSGAAYSGRMRTLIHQLKYGRYASLGPRLGWGLGRFFESPKADLLVPVPLHLDSLRRYNQAEGIARGLTRAWRIRTRNAARWTRRVEARVGLTGEERRALPADAFEVERIEGLRVILVDDVCTTGMTLSRLALSCQRGGAEVMGAYVLAHVPS